MEKICEDCGASFVLKQRARKARFCSNLCGIRGAQKKRAALVNEGAINRFWGRVSIGDVDNCWKWCARTDKQGYGHLSWRGNDVLAHRVAMSLQDGDWGSMLSVCHTCDNPSCCNPAHLWRGTHSENMEDMARKGRSRNAPLLGEVHPNAKLADDQIHAIRSSTQPLKATASLFGISETTVRNIKSGTSWRHLS